MQNIVLPVLRFGITRVRVTENDIESRVGSGRLPVCEIPSGGSLVDVQAEFVSPFVSVIGGKLVPFRFSLGTVSDQSYYLQEFGSDDWDKGVTLVPGNLKGAFFLDPKIFSCSSVVQLYYSIPDFIWEVGSELPTNDGRGGLVAKSTQGLMVCGNAAKKVFFYLGGHWANAPDVSATHEYGAMAGKPNSCLSIGGYNGSAIHNVTEYFNGAVWTTVAQTLYAVQKHGAVGLDGILSVLVFGGHNGTAALRSTMVYQINAWIAGPQMNTARSGPGFFGVPSSALVAGGEGDLTSSEVFNGISWSTGYSLPLGGSGFGGGIGSGNNAGVVAFGQSTGAAHNKSFVLGTYGWFHGPQANVARMDPAVGGDATFSLGVGGYNGTAFLNVNETLFHAQDRKYSGDLNLTFVLA